MTVDPLLPPQPTSITLQNGDTSVRRAVWKIARRLRIYCEVRLFVNQRLQNLQMSLQNSPQFGNACAGFKLHGCTPRANGPLAISRPFY